MPSWPMSMVPKPCWNKGCCRRSWCSLIPVFCDPVTACQSRITATCTFTPSISDGHRMAAGGCSRIARKVRQGRAMPWKIASFCRASCRTCSRNATCSVLHRFLSPCDRRCWRWHRVIAPIPALSCSPPGRITNRTSSMPIWPATWAIRWLKARISPCAIKPCFLKRWPV